MACARPCCRSCCWSESPVNPAGPALSSDWPHYGGGPEQIRYSPLTQITPANVASLKVAWTYDTGDAFEGSEMQCQPVVAHGVLYATSPKLRVFALDAATGQRSGASIRTKARRLRAGRASAD